MSLWHCPEHGLVGPSPCCPKSSRAQVEMAKPPAVVTDLQRLDSRLSAAAYRLKNANKELHLAEIEHRLAGEAVCAELARLQSDRGGVE